MPDNYSSKRVERSKTAVLEETYRQLTRGGLSGVSIDDIARQSGVAKTTIYRHWPTRSALLIDACSRMGSAQTAPDRGNLADDLAMLTHNVAESLREASWASVLPSIIDVSERDPEIATMQANMHRANMVPFFAAFEAAKERGEVRPNVTVETLVAMTLGPLFYRRWFSKEELDDDFVDAVIAATVSFAQER